MTFSSGACDRFCMVDAFEHQAAALGFRFVPSNPTFDIGEKHPEIARALALASPGLGSVLATVRSKIPLARSANTGAEHRFYRLASHNRSFCYALRDGDDIFNGPAIVWKGTEPLLDDFEKYVDWMAKAPFKRSTRVMADHFPLSEGKIPGALSLAEARRETDISLEVQAKHLGSYGELARLPTPLFIHPFSEADNRRAAEVLRRRLSPPAFERIEPLLARGLGVYVYHYPAAPIRSNFWTGLSGKKLSDHVKSSFDETAAVSGWVKLIVRLLYLGYLPYSIRNEGLGACMDAGNATIDGGFCDLDSVIPIETNADDEYFRQSFIECLSTLQTTVERLIAKQVTKPDFGPDIETFAFSRYLCRQIELAIETEARPGLRLDPRVPALLSPKSLADVKSVIARENRPNWYSLYVKQRGGPS